MRCFVLNIVVAERNHYEEEEMMGRFAYSMNVSLDLRIEQVPGDNGAGEWLRISEELHREFNARTHCEIDPATCAAPTGGASATRPAPLRPAPPACETPPSAPRRAFPDSGCQV